MDEVFISRFKKSYLCKDNYSSGFIKLLLKYDIKI